MNATSHGVAIQGDGVAVGVVKVGVDIKGVAEYVGVTAVGVKVADGVGEGYVGIGVIVLNSVA